VSTQAFDVRRCEEFRSRRRPDLSILLLVETFMDAEHGAGAYIVLAM